MDYQEAKARISELKKIIEESNRAYYVEDAPNITDFEYDELFRELNRIEAEYP